MDSEKLLGVSQHSPGPWEACDPGDYGDFDGQSRVISNDDMRIAVVHWDNGPTRGENDANAHLIAAAPELLTALIEAAEFIQPFNRAEDLLDRIDAAIAKARGHLTAESLDERR